MACTTTLANAGVSWTKSMVTIMYIYVYIYIYMHICKYIYLFYYIYISVKTSFIIYIYIYIHESNWNCTSKCLKMATLFGEHGDLAVDLGARCIERCLCIYIYLLYEQMVLSQRKHKCTILYPEVGALTTTNGNDWQSDVTQKH